MSNYLGIAATTATLRNLLMNVDTGIPADPILADTQVTTKPLDKAHTSDQVNQLNIFLYHTAPNAQLRNMEMLVRMKPGEEGQFPVAMNLYYLITAYGRGNDDVMAHRLLGRAVSILNDYPILSREEIKAALPGNDLYLQPEHVRITPQSLGVEEMFRLWATFQSAYRISVVYEVAVVMIESTLPISAPLPVLGVGPTAQPNGSPVSAMLTSALPPGMEPSALAGDTIVLSGSNLAGDLVIAVITWPEPVGGEVPPVMLQTLPGGTATMQSVVLDTTSGLDWQAGVYRIALVISKRGTDDRVTNELPLAIAPAIASITPAVVTRDAEGGIDLTLTVRYPVQPEQRVVLLVGDREVTLATPTAPTSVIEAHVPNIAAGSYYLRLRIDGVDSHLVDRGSSPPAFDQAALVTVQ